jgi:hypothetical protein
MARVYVIWFLRKMTSRFALEFLSFAALFVFFAYNVSLSHIASNFYLSLHSFSAVVDFILSAFVAAETIVLATFAGLTAVFLFIIKDLIRVTFRPTRAF